MIESFSVSITDKKMDELIEGIEDSLEKAGCVRKEKGGLFGGKNVYIPDPKVVDCIIQNIRAEILEEGRLSEEVVALTALFHKSGDLARYFSAYEKKDMKKRLKEIKQNPPGWKRRSKASSFPCSKTTGKSTTPFLRILAYS